MKLIRLAALIAVTLTAIACDSTTEFANIKELEVPADQTIVGANDQLLQDLEKTENEFQADTIRTQQQAPGHGQQRPQQDPIRQPDWDKKIIKTALLNVEIKDYDKFYNAVREKIKGLGGYIAQEEQVQTDYKIQNSLVIKIPVDQFDNAVAQVTVNTEKINEKKINSQDVTTEVVDTKSRMEAKKQVRQRYMDLLKQAKNMEEILSVQSEINDIQVEIESAAGRIQYLGNSSTFSTIHLTYYQVLNAAAKGTDSPSFGTKLGHAFGTGWSWFGDLFIGLVSIWPLYLLIFLCVIVYKKSRIQGTKQLKA